MGRRIEAVSTQFYGEAFVAASFNAAARIAP